jgi:hypothetical protein
MIGIFLGVLPIPQGCGTNVLAPYTKRSAGIQAMTKTRSTVLQCAVILAAFVASAARADLKDENLLVTAPPGYKVGFSDKKLEIDGIRAGQRDGRELDGDGNGSSLLRA